MLPENRNTGRRSMDHVIGRRTFMEARALRHWRQPARSGLAAAAHRRAAPFPTRPAPKLKAPALACDCHHHIYDAARFPPKNADARIIPDARVPEYRRLQRRIGTGRNIV